VTVSDVEVAVDSDERRLHDMLAENAQRFDIPSLLYVLDSIGYGLEDIRFRGNADPSPPRGVVEAVEFDVSRRQANVTLNMGLNGHRGWLPAYFEEVAESIPEPERLYQFIEFFEDGLLRDYARSITPEVHTNYQNLIDAQFSMLGLASTSTLVWLFTLIFPELNVGVRRTRISVRTDAHALTLGGPRGLDGSGVLGTSYDAAATGFSVELLAEDEFASAGCTWWHVAKERMRDDIAPILAFSDVMLEVVLVVADHASWVHLGAGGQLGYDRVAGATSEHRVVIYQDGAFCEGDLTPGRSDRWTLASPWNTPVAAI